MKRRRRSNGCLLSLLKTIVVGSFVVLMSFFGMYAWVVSGNEEKSKEVASTSSVPEGEYTGSKPIEVIERVEPPAYEIYQQPEELPVVQQQSKSNVGGEASQEVEVQDVPVTTDTESVAVSLEEVKPSTEEVVQPSDENSVAKEVVQVEPIEVPQLEEPVDISVYDRYELNLDDAVLKEAHGIVKDGQIDVTTVVAQYFASMSMQEKMRLINMLISKIKNVDIGYVWGIVADGITVEETAILQKLIEENFTEQEIDELYTYYAKSELAQLP
ncbi:MAG: hypothetical protein ACRCWY_10250 [Cellulosilyticaceae bacterium]